MTEWSQFRMDASQHISRAAGQSAVAAAAYRSGEKLLDERTGEIKDYSRRSGVVSAELVMPDGADVDWTRERLWNQAEAASARARMGGRDRQPIRGRGGLCDSSPRSRGRPAQSSCAYDDDDTENQRSGTR